MSHSYDVICFSHLRWDFVFQRPQHLLSRCAKRSRVFYIEEPVFDVELGASSRIDVRQPNSELNLWVVVPHLPPDVDSAAAQRDLLDRMLLQFRIDKFVCWYYTPMALPFTGNLNPSASVYDAMDQLSAFAGAPPEMHSNERRLFRQVDLVFTGGRSLYEAKKSEHHRVYAFPSSVEVEHFQQARGFRARRVSEPADQADIAHPRAGFFGVIDERFDTKLLEGIAALRPNVQFIMIGPVVKIDPAMLPRRCNIHYLGNKAYMDLPSYVAGWDVALMPFALNESTRFISPTKTPEYLAAGCPVVSTPIPDVVHPYGESGYVHIASDAPAFAAAIDAAVSEDRNSRLTRVDQLLSKTSWDDTWARMSRLIDEVVDARHLESIHVSGHDPEPVGASIASADTVSPSV